MDRSHELEIIRRSLAMLNPGQQALRREDAIALVEELADLTKRLEVLRRGLARLIDEDEAVGGTLRAVAMGTEIDDAPKIMGDGEKH